MTAFFENDKLSTCGFIFHLSGMVKGFQLNVVDRPILWHTTYLKSAAKAEVPLIHAGPHDYQKVAVI